MAIKTKICSNPECGEELLATTEFFHNRKDSKDGLRSDCKKCFAKQSKKRHKKNKNSVNANRRLQYRNKEEKEKIAKRGKKYRDANRNKINARVNNYYRHNKEKIKERCRKYRIENREARNLYLKNRKILRNSKGPGVTLKDWKAILSKYNYRCAYCGVTADQTKQGYLTRDHVIALSNGGEHSPENITPACMSCNTSKGAKLNWKKPKIFSKDDNRRRKKLVA